MSPSPPERLGTSLTACFPSIARCRMARPCSAYDFESIGLIRFSVAYALQRVDQIPWQWVQSPHHSIGRDSRLSSNVRDTPESLYVSVGMIAYQSTGRIP